jgi:hypothetical protein
MATYLQGVTDYIPDYQPFQPDFNFYSNLLQAKQTQYDSNWKQLNNVYGQLYSADLTHDLNVKKKDELLKQIDFNLKRVSGLDLSLEQNVDQAMQVFRPFYEDKYLMKDMAWTKNWTNKYNYANGLKTSQDEKQRSQWWGVGMKGLELRKQMFKDASLDETLNMANAEYTPFVNATQEYMDLAKKYNVNKVEQLPDQSGLYLVRKKNGELILPTLQNLFLAEYGNRPDIQDMYREKAFVERMNYAYQNKDKFGSTLEAEKDYIKTKYEWLKNYASDQNTKAKDNLNTTENLMGNLEKDIKSGDVNPLQNNYGKSLEELFAVDAVIAENASKLNDQINDKQSTSVVEGNDSDILSDMELARLKIDAGYASVEAEQDIMRAANGYADLDSGVEYKPNAVGLEFLRDKNARARQSQAHLDREAEIRLQNEQKMFQKAVDYNVSKNYWSFNQDGTLNTNPQRNGFNLNFIMPSPGSNTEGKFTFDELQRMSRETMIDQKATNGVDHLMKTIQNGVTTGSFTAAQLAQMITKLNPSDPTAKRILKEGSSAQNLAAIKKVWGSVWKDYTNDPTAFTRRTADNGQIYNLNASLQTWATQHAATGVAKLYFKDEAIMELQQMSRVDDALNVVRNQNYDNIRNKFRQDLGYIVAEVKAKDPQKYANVTPEKIDQAVNLVMNRYALDGKGHTEEFNKIAAQVDEQVSAILGFSIGKKTNQPAEKRWYNYVFPLTNIPGMVGDGRENVEAGASWVADVFDNSFDELTNLPPDQGGLQAYFPSIVKKGGKGNEYGLAAETGMMKVAPGVQWDPGNQSASSMFTTILATNWNQDQSKYRITTNGNILPGSDEEWANTGIDKSEALAVVTELQAQLNTNKDLNPFFIGGTTVAMENEGLGSMKLMAPREVIEKAIKSVMGADAKESDVKAKIDKIYQNGITFIAPSSTWTSNPLYGNQFPTATEALLRQGPINFKDPTGTGSYTITKTPGGSDYIGAVEAYEMLPDGSKKRHEQYWDLDVRSGKTIDQKEMQSFNMINSLRQLNFDMYRKIHQSGDQKAIENANKNFGITPENPFWNYNK